MRIFIVLIWCFWFVGVDAQNRFDRIPGGELGEDPETGKKGKEADLCRLLYFLVWPL